MKKFLTLVLALVMALAIAVPAMAFVKDEGTYTSNLELDAFLVDYSDNLDLFVGSGVFTSLPETDRGYATNEMVAVLVTIDAPKKFAMDPDAASLTVEGDNVRFYAAGYYENDKVKDADEAGLALSDNKWDSKKDFDLSCTKATTYKWLILGRVQGDEASITVTLNEKADKADSFDYDKTTKRYTASSIKLGDFTVSIRDGKLDGNYVYVITFDDDYYKDYKAIVVVEDDFDAIRLVIGDGSELYELNTSGQYRQIMTYTKGTGDASDYAGATFGPVLSSSASRDLRGFYEELADALGIDYAEDDAKVRPAYFEGLFEGSEQEIVIDIEPWTAYVSIPDVEVIDPPKTGDAATLVGFVMILAALAGVVVFKKVRA